VRDGRDASIIITTRNRRQHLRGAVASSLEQTAGVEVLVMDDASTDGTAEMVEREFPEARLLRSERPLGYIEQRNRAADLATAPILVSIDDDAELVSPQTVEQTLEDFDHPRIGAVAIPHVDRVPGGDVLRQSPPDRARRWVTPTYFGTAYAFRRSLFLYLGGYWTPFAHMCEEYDLCLRMLNTGYVVRLGRADELHHLRAPRDEGSNLTRQMRNDLLTAWRNVPLPYLPLRLAKQAAGAALLSLRWRRPTAVARGMALGLRDVWRMHVERSPVERAAYRLDHDLRRRGPLPLEEIEARLAETPSLEALDVAPAGGLSAPGAA
jgi:GT2 family glycosyltransferase